MSRTESTTELNDDHSVEDDSEPLSAQALLAQATPPPILTPHQFLPPNILTPHSVDGPNPEISPWAVGELVGNTTPQPAKRSFGFGHKASLASLPFVRQSNSSPSFGSRGSDSQSLLAESYTPTLTEMSPQDLRKGKASSFFSDIMKKKRSRSKLSSDINDSMSTITYLPSNHSQVSVDTFMTPLYHDPLPPPAPPYQQPPPKKEKEKNRTKRARLNKPPPVPPKDEPMITLDTDLARMEGILNLSVISNQSGGRSSTSPSSRFDSSSVTLSGFTPPLSSSSMFTDPFNPSAESSKPKIQHDLRKVSPKTIVGPYEPDGDGVVPSTEREWTAPESWAVEKEGEDAGADGGGSSSEESIVPSSSRTPDDASTVTDGTSKKRMRRKMHHAHKPTSSSASNKVVLVRIYRANGSYHVAQIPPHATVADLTPSLNARVLRDHDRETHKLYLKERGRERVLAPTERPAAITRRRLEQAGYDQADSLDYLAAEDMTFLLKFVYKSQLLGPAAEDLNLDNCEYVELTGCSLPAIPIILHKDAASIVCLNLSRNPMVEIPLDFIQSCVTLRELRLSSMAMKKVPQSVRHSASLHRLDLSCNRIVDLDDAGLDRIPQLSRLRLQNNRMEQLPWYFPRLRMLKYLNISNNKFTHVPSVICEMSALVDLDISFNTITELPEDIGRLSSLDNFVFVGNQVSRLPEQFSQLSSLRTLDCRRNNISDLAIAHSLPRLGILHADHNFVHALDLSRGSYTTTTLDVSYNDITLLKLVPSMQTPYALTSLDVSHAKLSSLDDFALSHLSALQHLKLDHNLFRALPDSFGDLSHLITLSCSDNHLDALPESIGSLQRLESLDAHSNSLTQLPVSLWNCASLSTINVTSNLLETWHDPPSTTLVAPPPSSISLEVPLTPPGSRSLYQMPRKASNATSLHTTQGVPSPPLAYSLERLYVGENRLTDAALPPFTILKELRVLNLSFNEIQETPSTFLRNLTKLEELYLSGNQLTSIPTEDLPRLTRLRVLFLNGNKLQTLPQELGKVQSLTVIDVGSNTLRYNINNWEFDWNWNFNQNLKYLNLSGNKRLEIKPDHPGTKSRSDKEQGRGLLADFSELPALRVLGLMDVTTTFLPNIPEETEDRRVRTSLSEVNKMSYGIADTLGESGYLTMLDLVQPEFRGQKDEAVFAMFGRSDAVQSNNHLSKYLHDNFLSQFSTHLTQIDRSRSEGVPDAMRRTFLRLNKQLHDTLYAGNTSHRKMSRVSASTAGTSTFDPSYVRAGASGVVLYFVGKTLYVANAGQSLSVISRQGSAELISRSHDPFDRCETARIRAAEGWISPKGLIHDEIDTSRSFGFFHDFPVVNARPDISVRQLTEQDEFVIIGNRGLWDYISYQTAVDIARSERSDPMIAAQKLRDFAISYGSKGSIMIMVIYVADLFRPKKQPTANSSMDAETYSLWRKRGGKRTDIADRTIARLEHEVSPPTGHLCLVFTDIRNSTQLWEANAGMPTAMRLHNSLLRRHLRLCGGYVVKTEGDAFMCSFPTTLAALWWSLTVQIQLLHESWPLEILECDEGKEVWDSQGNLIARGLSVRMGIHCGTPVCEPDPITNRMDYFGPMVIRAARISGNAAGGQIMCSADVVREINARITETGPDTEYSEFQPPQAIDAIQVMNIKVIPVGEIKLKGLEIPEMVSLIYPGCIAGRQDLDSNAGAGVSAKVQWSIAQVKELAMLCLRIEALASSRIFRVHPGRKESTQEHSEDEQYETSYMYGDPNLLLPPMNDKMTELEIMMVLDSLLTRLENAASSLSAKSVADESAEILTMLRSRGGFDERTLSILSSLLCS
ncbi:hypothetical protein BS17DRAFT_727058 [Gyrodon lividus]|nr:hypothetical protein BS17DRAFT_727058 [Gyrodon lividus]